MAGGKKSKDYPRTRTPAKREPSFSGDDVDLDIDAFNVILRKKNLYVRDVSSDGNCLFRAVSDQLYGSESRQRELRQQACRYMRDHETSFAPFIDTDSYSSFASYVQNMEVENRWGGNSELQALSCSLLLDVRIHQVGAPSYDIKNDHGKRNKDKQTIHLSYHDGQHYASVRRLDEGEDGYAGAAHRPLRVAPVVGSTRKDVKEVEELEILTKTRARAQQIDERVAAILRAFHAGGVSGVKVRFGAEMKHCSKCADCSCCGQEKCNSVRPRISSKARRALEVEAADIRDLAADAVKRAARMNALLQRDEDAEYDKNDARSKRKVYSMLDSAQASADDLEERMKAFEIQESELVNSPAPPKRPSKKKAQQAKIRDRKNRRMREQERNAVGDMSLARQEVQVDSEVSI